MKKPKLPGKIRAEKKIEDQLLLAWFGKKMSELEFLIIRFRLSLNYSIKSDVRKVLPDFGEKDHQLLSEMLMVLARFSAIVGHGKEFQKIASMFNFSIPSGAVDDIAKWLLYAREYCSGNRQKLTIRQLAKLCGKNYENHRRSIEMRAKELGVPVRKIKGNRSDLRDGKIFRKHRQYFPMWKR